MKLYSISGAGNPRINNIYVTTWRISGIQIDRADYTGDSWVGQKHRDAHAPVRVWAPQREGFCSWRGLTVGIHGRLVWKDRYEPDDPVSWIPGKGVCFTSINHIKQKTHMLKEMCSRRIGNNPQRQEPVLLVRGPGQGTCWVLVPAHCSVHNQLPE